MTDNPTPEVKISVPADQTPKRIDKFIAENLPGVSRSYIQILIQEGKVSCSGKAVK
ncbi:MAG: RNA pseudouridine synthase, partial [Deferribacteres bacterium]|nr:RNA pseudouridine synthase [Deferribacteres bacterium]